MSRFSCTSSTWTTPQSHVTHSADTSPPPPNDTQILHVDKHSPRTSISVIRVKERSLVPRHKECPRLISSRTRAGHSALLPSWRAPRPPASARRIGSLLPGMTHWWGDGLCPGRRDRYYTPGPGEGQVLSASLLDSWIYTWSFKAKPFFMNTNQMRYICISYILVL